RTGGKVRIAAQLINVANGFYVWSETYERDFQSVFSLEDEVSGKVAEALEVRFAAGERPAITQSAARNSEAYDFYLRGRFFWNKRTEEGVRKGIGYFDQAIEKDPNFALGHCGLADSYSMLCLYSGIDPEAGFTTAKAHALKAIELNEKLSDAHTSLAFVLHSWDFDWARAGMEYHRAIELAPNSAIAHHWFALYLAEMSRFPEAITESRRAQKLDPLSLVVNSELALILHFGRQYDEAISQSKKLLDLQPNLAAALAVLGQACAEKGQYDEAAAAVKQLQAATKSEVPDLQLAYIDAKRGDVAAAEKTLQTAMALRESKEVSPYEIGMVFATLKKSDEAFKYLGKALDEHSVLAPILRVDPRLDTLRGDPRFGPLLARIGLSDAQLQTVAP
ncbi:MAG: tetratricopeptide repeat protein, partial [Verrucomicrobiota bacterium]|nr:tetratricopeptide repeat protein [Verrucomicrobiota bacterium]